MKTFSNYRKQEITNGAPTIIIEIDGYEFASTWAAGTEEADIVKALKTGDCKFYPWNGCYTSGKSIYAMLVTKGSQIEFEATKASELQLSDEQARIAFFHLLGGLAVMKQRTDKNVAQAIKRAVLHSIQTCK